MTYPMPTPVNDPRDHELHPLEGTAHQHCADNHDRGALQQSSLPPQPLSSESRGDGAKDGAHIGEGGNRADHQIEGLDMALSQYCEMTIARHDALVVAVEEEEGWNCTPTWMAAMRRRGGHGGAGCWFCLTFAIWLGGWNCLQKRTYIGARRLKAGTGGVESIYI